MEAHVVEAVLDTSVLVPFRSRIDLQHAVDAGLYEAYWSPWIVAELNRILTVTWLGRTEAALTTANLRAMSRSSKGMMERLAEVCNVVNPRLPYPPAWPGLQDLDDLPIWAAAQIVQADYVVSANTHDYPPSDSEGRHMWQGVEYISASNFFQLILS